VNLTLIRQHLGADPKAIAVLLRPGKGLLPTPPAPAPTKKPRAVPGDVQAAVREVMHTEARPLLATEVARLLRLEYSSQTVWNCLQRMVANGAVGLVPAGKRMRYRLLSVLLLLLSVSPCLRGEDFGAERYAHLTNLVSVANARRAPSSFIVLTNATKGIPLTNRAALLPILATSTVARVKATTASVAPSLPFNPSAVQEFPLLPPAWAERKRLEGQTGK
jgi:hypothetical protein